MTEYVGSYIVVPTAAAARAQAWRLCDNKARELWKLRRQAFKLAYWPDGDLPAATDLDWDWIKGLEKLRIGELRIDEPINAHENVRVIFFKANRTLDGEALCRIWLLAVFAKKRQDFGKGQLQAFKGSRTILVQREYGGVADA